MNKLLQRQIRKLIGDADGAPEEFGPLFEAISNAYDEFDADRHLIERSLDISSEELRQVNTKLRQEVSDREQAEEAARQSEQFLNHVFESIQDGISVLDPELQIMRVNKAMKDWYPHELPLEGKKCYEAYYGRSHPCEICPTIRALKSGKLEHDEVRLIQDDEVAGVFDLFAFPMVDESGKAVGVVEYVRDVTEKKHAEEMLIKSKENLQVILDSMPLGVIVVGNDKTIRQANNAAASMLGYESFRELMGADYNSTICTANNDSCSIPDSEHEIDRSENELLKKDGRLLPVLRSVIPIKLYEEQVLLETFIDITELKKTKDEQARLLRKLEQVNQELKEFAYVVSHDLKAPLKSIETTSEWLVKNYSEKLDERGADFLELLVSRSQKMQKLVDGILKYSRADGGKEENSEVNLHELVEDLINMLNTYGNIEVNIEGQLPVIVCQETKMAQVFQNLLSNAMKYMDKPDGKIVVRCSDGGSCWKFSVSDNGPGIKKEYHERIFKLFQTLAPNKGADSTGVGLSVVKKIVENNRGRVWVESELGQGTTFHFTFPKIRLTQLQPC